MTIKRLEIFIGIGLTTKVDGRVLCYFLFQVSICGTISHAELIAEMEKFCFLVKLERERSFSRDIQNVGKWLLAH